MRAPNVSMMAAVGSVRGKWVFAVSSRPERERTTEGRGWGINSFVCCVDEVWTLSRRVISAMTGDHLSTADIPWEVG